VRAVSDAGEHEPRHPARTRLARVRQRRGVTQEELAELIGVSVPTYQRLERGTMRNPPLRYLSNCALALGVKLEDVIDTSWREWYPFDPRYAKPPAKGWWKTRDRD
jgi:transcriptional regulator with XRE-family HTH domain